MRTKRRVRANGAIASFSDPLYYMNHVIQLLRFVAWVALAPLELFSAPRGTFPAASIPCEAQRGLVLTRSCVTQAYTAVARATKLELKHDASKAHVFLG
ncbi:protein of unknown function [Methylocella tundrae]|uniref:Uncharacterized protein n=1 Tax=Methylocella tundrae TaxID=227605 RepID=A0A4U8Z1C6_METTU|nr:protein of unknown function [Methylocella tundrae]